ncbi:MAG: cation diffusion facilitator family transporter [Pseudomonadota bacterium]|nr:cation diffusion facilitator family transporter [Pseudomonadota bacterium]
MAHDHSPHGHSHSHGHGHGHGHSHGHSHGDGRIGWAVAVNLALTVAQIVGGILSGSLMLIADALHNLSDAMSLVIAFAARRIARRPADEVMTFGYARAEVVAALINLTTLILISLFLAWEAVSRLIDPQPVDGWVVVWIASLALVIDVGTALLIRAQAKDSLNLRAAFLHNLADAGASAAVIVGGIAVATLGWMRVDGLLTLALSVWIIHHSWGDLGESIRILMNAAPAAPARDEVREAMEEVEGVASVHHVHLWRIDERRLSLEAHLVSETAGAEAVSALRVQVRQVLGARFGIAHVTLEIEFPGEPCAAPAAG